MKKILLFFMFLASCLHAVPQIETKGEITVKRTPLMVALKSKKDHIAWDLMTNIAVIDFSAKDESNRLAVYYALKYSTNNELVDKIYRLSKEHLVASSCLPIYFVAALQGGFTNIALDLLTIKSLNSIRNNTKDPLKKLLFWTNHAQNNIFHVLIAMQSWKVFHALLSLRNDPSYAEISHGSDCIFELLHQKNLLGQTPLMYAVARREKQAAFVLCKVAGFDVFTRDNKGKDLFAYCKIYNQLWLLPIIQRNITDLIQAAQQNLQVANESYAETAPVIKKTGNQKIVKFADEKVVEIEFVVDAEEYPTLKDIFGSKYVTAEDDVDMTDLYS